MVAVTQTADLSPNKKQQAFCTEYLKDFNATQAAIRAGYSAKTAGQIGFALLKKVEIQQKIQDTLNASANRVGMTIERADQILADILEATVADYEELLPDGEKVTVFDKNSPRPHAVKMLLRKMYSTGSGDGKMDVTVAGVELHDKLKALEVFYKRRNLFNQDSGGSNGINVTFVVNARQRHERPAIDVPSEIVQSPRLKKTFALSVAKKAGA